MTENKLAMPNYIHIGVKLFCTISIIVMVLISFIEYHVSLSGLMMFFLFLLSYIQLPGLLLHNCLKVNAPNMSTKLLISFFTGWALIVIEYFLSVLINSNIVLAATGPIMSLIYIVAQIRNRSNHRPSLGPIIKSLPSSMFIYVTIVMLYIFLLTQFLYMSPNYAANITMSIDKAFQMGIVTSITHGFPVANPWIANRFINYHIFSQILLSVPVSLFGIDADFMIMTCAPYLTTYLLSLSAYSLFVHFCSKKERAGLYALSIILAHLFAARSLTSSYLFRVVIGNDNYGGYALASMASCIIALDVCLKQHSRKQFMSALPILVLQILLLSGIKAPVALVVVGGFLGTALLGLIMRKIPLARTITIVALSLIAFISVYSLLLNYGDTSGGSGTSIFAIGDMSNICFWKKPLISLLKAVGLPLPVRHVMVLLAFVATFLTIYTLPFFFGYLRELILVLRGVSDFDYSKVTVYAVSIVGFVMMMILRYEGHSQVYFGSVLMFLAPLITFWFFEDVSPSSSRITHVVANISKIWFFTLIIFTSFTLALSMRSMIPDAVKHSDPAAKYNPYNSLSADEYEAINWIKDNVPYDTLVSTQMYSSYSYNDYNVSNRWANCHFLYAAFSDRRFYLEGSGFSFGDSEISLREEMVKNTDSLYDPNNSSRAVTARNLGIGYVMATKKLHPTPDLSSDEYKLVFSNNDIDIYKVLY